MNTILLLLLLSLVSSALIDYWNRRHCSGSGALAVELCVLLLLLKLEPKPVMTFPSIIFSWHIARNSLSSCNDSFLFLLAEETTTTTTTSRDYEAKSARW